MGEEASTSYLQRAAKMGVLGDVDAYSIAALQFFPGKPRVTLEDGWAGPPRWFVGHALLKRSKTDECRYEVTFRFLSIDNVYRTNNFNAFFSIFELFFQSRRNVMLSM